jgi:hypothetical protein
MTQPAVSRKVLAKARFPMPPPLHKKFKQTFDFLAGLA